MTDPTYSRSEIRANPVWDLAFVLSEVMNDDAPIGWGKYIFAAECLLGAFEIRRKPAAPVSPPEPSHGQ
jgi:hypothetical protein